MRMDSYPYDVWELHRKLFHRYLKYRKYFDKATKTLPEYKDAADIVKPEVVSNLRVVTPPTESVQHHVINLLSSSEAEVSDATGDDSDDVSMMFVTDGESSASAETGAETSDSGTEEDT